MPTSGKQKRAACADYGRAKAGKTPRTFKGMSREKLRDFCVSPVKKAHGGKIYKKSASYKKSSGRKRG